jgi:hypothetical protein
MVGVTGSIPVARTNLSFCLTFSFDWKRKSQRIRAALAAPTRFLVASFFGLAKRKVEGQNRLRCRPSEFSSYFDQAKKKVS